MSNRKLTLSLLATLFMAAPTTIKSMEHPLIATAKKGPSQAVGDTNLADNSGCPTLIQVAEMPIDADAKDADAKKDLENSMNELSKAVDRAVLEDILNEVFTYFQA